MVFRFNRFRSFLHDFHAFEWEVYKILLLLNSPVNTGCHPIFPHFSALGCSEELLRSGTKPGMARAPPNCGSPFSGGRPVPEFVAADGLGVSRHGLGAGMDVKLFVDVPNMGANRGQTDTQGIGYFLESIAPGGKIQHLVLPRRKTCITRRTWLGTLKALNDFAGDIAAHGGAARMHISQCRQQSGTLRSLEQIAARARGQRVENMAGVLIDGQHHKLGLRHFRLQPADTLNPVHARQIDVGQHKVRPFLGQAD